jgi:Tfp pilus assembly protein PilF
MNASEVRRDSRRVGGRAASRGLVALFGILLLFPGLLQAKGKKAPSASEELAFGVQMAQRYLWSEALFRFRQAERLEPGNIRAMNNIAVALEAIGRFEDALAAYQQALKADPNNMELKRNYGRFAEFYQSFKTKPKTEPVMVPTEPPPGGAF